MTPRHAEARGWRAACLALAAVLALPAHGGEPGSSADTAQATQALVKWLRCAACEDEKHLKAVTTRGQALVPSLIAALNTGLSPAERAALEQAYGVRYDLLEEQGRQDPRFRMKSTKSQFIERYVDELDARSRARAALALGEIGGADARAALQASRASARRPDVRKAIEGALQKAGP